MKTEIISESGEEIGYIEDGNSTIYDRRNVACGYYTKIGDTIHADLAVPMGNVRCCGHLVSSGGSTLVLTD
jgi:hypothetical protein